MHYIFATTTVNSSSYRARQNNTQDPDSMFQAHARNETKGEASTKRSHASASLLLDNKTHSTGSSSAHVQKNITFDGQVK